MILSAAEQRVRAACAAVHDEELRDDIKPGNQARIGWANPESPQPTPLSVVYLHGLTASPGEAGDFPERIARSLGANVFVARLPGHGMVDPEAMRGLSRPQLIAAASQALAVGQALGDRVVLVGTSIGASLALLLAAADPDIAALVLWSPGVRARDQAQLNQLRSAGDTVLHDPRPRSADQLRFWSASVHADAYRSLHDLFEQDMAASTFRGVTAPVFMAYYFADDERQDQTASVPAMLDMFRKLGTPDGLKQAMPYANGTHVIGSPYRSDVAPQVLADSLAFLQRVLAPSAG